MVRSIFFAALAVLTVFSVVIYTSCTKTETAVDKCEGVICNHGVCVEGVCKCNTGYQGTLCDKRDCEVNNTSRVKFENKTGSSLTYNVVWDGSTLTTLAPGAISDYFTVAAGQHTLHFLISNGGEACTPSTPVLVQCYDHSYYCTK